MKIGYFECNSGIAGNMILGALLDAGLPKSELVKELNKLKIKFALKVRRVKKGMFYATNVDVIPKGRAAYSSPEQIYRIIRHSTLSARIKVKALKIFKRLAAAEAKVHRRKSAHFHEVGATDSMVDIVGAVIGLEQLGIELTYSSPINVGSGIIKFSHGIIPVPAPATAELLKGIPVYNEDNNKDKRKELTTPTGAAIISTLAESFGAMPKMIINKIGHGAGSWETKKPNILRLFIGESAPKYRKETLLNIECNIDDMNPELYEYVIERLMKAGARDVSVEPIRMKKLRPAVKLSVLAEDRYRDTLLDIIFSETTTLGVKIFDTQRLSLERRIKEVKIPMFSDVTSEKSGSRFYVGTKYGKVKVKLGLLNGKIKNIAPEYESCKILAKKLNVPLKEIYREALSAHF